MNDTSTTTSGLSQKAQAKLVDVPTEPVYHLPLDRVKASKVQPRKIFDKTKLAELTADVKENGVKQPVLVRPLGDGDWELVWGERRWRASTAAERATIPAFVREMTDEQAFEEALRENINRADLTPMEEAEAFERLAKVQKLGAKELAAKFGCSTSHIYRRMKLTGLAPSIRKIFANGEIGEGIAFLLARIADTTLQNEALEAILEEREYGDFSDSDAAQLIRDRFMLVLALAPFDQGDASLVKSAGPCTTCPHRTGNQPELFADLKDLKSKDHCTKPSCYHEKVAADWRKRAAVAEKAGTKVLAAKEAKKVFDDYGEHAVAAGAGYVEARAKCELDPKGRTWAKVLGAAAPPLVLAQDQAGRARELYPATAARKELPEELEEAAPAKASRGAGGVDPAEVRRRREQAKKRATTKAIITAVVGEAEAHIAHHVGNRDLWVFFLGRLLGGGYHDSVTEAVKRRGLQEPKKRAGDILEKYAKTLEAPQLYGLVVELLITSSAYFTYAMGLSEDLKAGAAFYGVDVKQIEKRVAAELADATKAKKPAAKKTAKKGKN